MQIGNYLELHSFVDDLKEAEKFYQALGFSPLGAGTWTDGSYNLRLTEGSGPAVSFHYYGCSEEAIHTFGEQIESPHGVVVRLNTEESELPMPSGEPLKRVSTSIMGLFGEFSIPVKDIDLEGDFWLQFGYEWTLKEKEAYPWGILIGPANVLGIHQVLNGTSEWVFEEITLTYFDKEMPVKIKAVKGAGIEFTSLGKNDVGDDVAAKMKGPGGLMFFMFTGEVV